MMFLIPFNSYTLMFCLLNVEGLMQPFADDLLHILICSCFHNIRRSCAVEKRTNFFGSFRKLLLLAVSGVAGKGLEVMVVSIKCMRILCLLLAVQRIKLQICDRFKKNYFFSMKLTENSIRLRI